MFAHTATEIMNAYMLKHSCTLHLSIQ